VTLSIQEPSVSEFIDIGNEADFPKTPASEGIIPLGLTLGVYSSSHRPAGAERHFG
jgi:hypothetical protein